MEPAVSKIGTCEHNLQIKEVWREPWGPDYSHPHSPKTYVAHETMPEMYECGWLETIGPTPPFLKRIPMLLRDGDCDVCPHYQPASDWKPSQ